MAMNKARRTANLNNILTYDTLGNSTLIANLTVEGLTGAGFVKADVNGLLSVDTAAYTVSTGATNYLTKITGVGTIGQSLVYDNGTSVFVNTTTGVLGYAHAFHVAANAAGGMIVSTTDIASAIGIVNTSSAGKTWDISPYGNHLVINESGVATRIKFDAGGNITIGDITNTGHKLEVVGSFRTTGNNTLSQLSGVGTRMVVADANGLLSTQAVSSGSISGSGASGQVAYWTGTSAQSGSNNLFWDNANSRLGIGINSPATIIDAKGDRATVTITDTNSGGTNPTFFGAFSDFLQLSVNRNPSTGIFAQTGKATSQISLEGAANASSIRFFATNTNNTIPDERLRLYGTGNLLIQSGGTYSDGGQRLQVQGTTLLNGNVTFSSSTGMFWDATNSRLGIGTNEPLYNLDVTGVVRIGNSTNGYIFNSNTISTFGNIFLSIQGDRFFSITDSSYNNVYFRVVRNTGNTLLNSTSDTGERLQVTGNVKITGGSSFGGNMNLSLNQNASTQILVQNTDITNTNSRATFQATSGAVSVRMDAIGAAGSYLGAFVGTTTNHRLYFWTNGQERGYFAENGNLVLGSISTGDTGEKLQVTGDVRINGNNLTVTGSGTTNFYITASHRFFHDAVGTQGRLYYTGGILFPSGSTGFNLFPSGGSESNTTGNFRISTRLLRNAHMFHVQAAVQLGTSSLNIAAFNSDGAVSFDPTNPLTASIASGLRIAETFAPDTTNKGSFYNAIYLQPTINQSPGLSLTQITRGIHIAPVLTNFADWRSIEWTNNTGWGIYGSGTASNYLAGRLGIGTATPAYNLDVWGPSTATAIARVKNFSSGNASLLLDAADNNSISIIGLSRASITNTYEIRGYHNQPAFGGLANAISFYQPGSTFHALVITEGRNLLVGSTTDTGERLQVTGSGYFSGALKIGTTDPSRGLRIGINATAADSSTCSVNLAVQNTVTTQYRSFLSSVGLSASGFTLPILTHYEAVQDGSFTAGVVTNHYGFRVNAFTSGTNIFAFHSNIGSATGRWNIYMAGTAANYMAGNLLLGSTTDSGERLQVTGDVKITGGSSGSGLFPLTVQNSLGVNALRVSDLQRIYIGSASVGSAPAIYAFEGTTGNRSLRIGIQSAGSLTPIPAFNINQESDYNYTSGTGEFTTITANFLPTSGTGTLAYLSIKGTINQTGGANGTTRGLYVNPTLTAADWRSIEWSNNSGYGLYGAGTANNYIAGSLGIGVLSPTSKLTVNGSLELQGGGGVIQTSNTSSIYMGTLNTSGTPIGGYILAVGNNTTDITQRGAVEVIYSTENSGQGGFSVFSSNGSGFTRQLQVTRSGNLIIQGGGIYTDTTERLQVTGASKFTGNVTITTLTSGYLPRASTGGLLTNSLVYDNGTSVLVNTATVIGGYTHSFQVAANAAGGMIVSATDIASAIGIVNTSSANKTWDISPFGNDLVINESGITTRLKFKAGGNIEAPVLAGTGTRMVVADSAGVLSTQSIPGGSITGTGVANRVAFWDGASSLTNSANFIWASATSRLGLGIAPTSRLHVAGTGNDNTTNSLIVENSSASVGLRVVDSGDVYVGDGAWLRVQGFSKRYIYKSDATNGIFSISSCSSLGATFNMYGATHASKPKTIEIGASYAPSSGTIAYNALEIASNIDQTGTANAITRGLYVNPVLNNAVSRNNWRSIAWTNNEGYGLFGIGTAQNLLSGKLTVNVTVASANLSNSENTISLFGAQTLNIPAATIGGPGLVYAAGTSANYMRFNGNTTMNGDALFAGKVVINSVQFDTTGTVTMSDSQTNGIRALSGLQVQMQAAGATSGTVTKGASILVQGAYPNNTAGTVTFTDYYGIRINNLLEWDSGATANRIAMTNRWGIFQAGADDRNHFNGMMLIGTATAGGSKIRVSGLPTSATGLSVGDVWNDAGTLRIVI